MSSATKAPLRIVESDREWRARLTPAQHHATREHGTERTFTGLFRDQKRAGTYGCVCRGAPLFAPDARFDSRTGWLSFFAPIDGVAVSEHADGSFFMRRTEVRCTTCDAHLGHVFPDGPQPTGCATTSTRQPLTSRNGQQKTSKNDCARPSIAGGRREGRVHLSF